MRPGRRAQPGAMASDLFILGRSNLDQSRGWLLRPGHDAGAPCVFEPVAFARDLHDGSVVQDAVEHGGSQHGVAREGLVPAPERQV